LFVFYKKNKILQKYWGLALHIIRTFFIIILLSISIPAKADIQISDIKVSESDGLTKINFKMNALVPLDLNLDKNNSQLNILIPEDVNLNVPAKNELMVGLFEGYEIKNIGDKKTLEIDIHPDAEISDSYSINDDAEHPKFVIELKDKNFKKPESDETSTLSPSISSGLKKIEIKKGEGFTTFRLYTNNLSNIESMQLGNKISITVPETDWSKIETDIIKLTKPSQEKSVSEDLYKDYHVNEEDIENPQLIIILEKNAKMIDEAFGEDGTQNFYEITLGLKTKKSSQAQGPDLNADKEVISDPIDNSFKTKPMGGIKSLPEAIVSGPKIPKKSLDNQNPMVHVLEKNPTIQTSKEGPIPDWVLEAQGNASKKN